MSPPEPSGPRPVEVALLASVFIVSACGLVYELAAGALASLFYVGVAAINSVVEGTNGTVDRSAVSHVPPPAASPLFKGRLVICLPGGAAGAAAAAVAAAGAAAAAAGGTRAQRTMRLPSRRGGARTRSG